LIQVACDHQETFDDNNGRLVLIGIYELADSCVEAIQEMPDRERYDHGLSEIILVKEFSEQGLQTGDFITAFRLIDNASMRATPLPIDTLKISQDGM
jgi:hypothetical protein